MSTDNLEHTWQVIRTHLERKKEQIVDEIRNYPPPIPACDVQFNDLIEARGKISVALNHLDAAYQQTPSAQTLKTMIQSSAYLDDEIRQQCTQLLQVTS